MTILFKQDGSAEIDGQVAPALGIFVRGLSEQKWRPRDIVAAKPVSQPFVIEGDEDEVYAAGDYLVKDEDGSLSGMSAESFNLIYERIPE